ncbi:universal stress protein [Epibacterium sp. MM17-32]|jgi:nucleotide-binding universal stress UspA family protein|uniref:universal stress protein n=1 Tax=Epibacterium sp. MM17-32 TaxID=2917734 RepID=UPI001EF6C2BE|nr:universal stress protein [Epibacterium sp. MM17-32]MCG7627766.1 universal stress protein [Epibacterium sp. MM17-32]
MFKSILVPFDGSQGAEGALAKAAELSLLCDAELTLLTVYRHHSLLEASMHVVQAEAPDDLDAMMRAHAREVAERGKTLAREAGVTRLRGFVKGGPVARTITGFARDHKNDLIVIGSRGLGSLEGVLLGSISHKVTSFAEMPVLIV